jgi:ubiquinone biosynthesis protein COQ9
MAAGPGELAAARENILRATLVHVPFNGWSKAALDRGIRDSGVEGPPARLAFQGGMDELAEYYCRFADERMLAALDDDAVAAMPMRARINHVVRLRLEQAETEREAVRALMSWLALPGNQALGARCLYRTVDAMWHGVGDTSTDFNFYSKRALLAGILAATVLYWLVDDSEGREATWVFLGRRVDDVLGIEKAKARVRSAISKLPDPFDILKRGFPGKPPPGA